MESSIVYALDFDGVLCDSVGESSKTALKAAAKLWPHLLVEEPYDERILSAIAQIRPVIETGYENVLLGRLALETDKDSLMEKFVTPVLNDWGSIRDAKLEEWQTNKDELIEMFGRVRDDWIENSTESWLNANRMYVDNFNERPP